jgi:hypothetical protein
MVCCVCHAREAGRDDENELGIVMVMNGMENVGVRMEIACKGIHLIFCMHFINKQHGFSISSMHTAYMPTPLKPSHDNHPQFPIIQPLSSE